MINDVLIIGSGTMGKGFAVQVAAHNLKCTLYVRNFSAIEAVSNDIKLTLKKLFKRNTFKIDLVQAIENISFTSSYEESLNNNKFQMVFEAVTEELSEKISVIEKCSEFLNDELIWATNTSSLSITEISSFYEYPQKVIGLHFFNPVTHMELVELIPSMTTSIETIELCKDFVGRVSKVVVEVEDNPGFVVNRLLIPMINEAVHLLETKTASAEEIDKAMKLGAHHPLGPLALADLIGIDVCLGIMESLQKGTGDSKYRPAFLMQKMVHAKTLGRKTKLGFFKY